jgi:hypothetical protein
MSQKSSDESDSQDNDFADVDVFGDLEITDTIAAEIGTITNTALIKGSVDRLLKLSQSTSVIAEINSKRSRVQQRIRH